MSFSFVHLDIFTEDMFLSFALLPYLEGSIKSLRMLEQPLSDRLEELSGIILSSRCSLVFLSVWISLFVRRGCMAGLHPTIFRDVVLVIHLCPSYTVKLQQLEVSDVVQQSKPSVWTPGFQTQPRQTNANRGQQKREVNASEPQPLNTWGNSSRQLDTGRRHECN